VQGNNVVPPSPALVRHGSKQRKMPTALTPGQLTAHPPQAHMPIGVNNNNNRANGQHPYAVAGIGAGYEDAQYSQHEGPYKAQPYGRTSSMAQVAVSKVRAMGGETGVSQDYHGPDLDGLNDDEPSKPSFLRILTCRC
jgi:casein kinase 1